MFKLPGGKRCLTEAEWNVVRFRAARLFEMLANELDSGIDPIRQNGIYFERLPKAQQLVVIRDTLRALRDPASTAPGLTAANEGALAEMVPYVRAELDCEFERIYDDAQTPLSTRVRQLLRAYVLTLPKDHMPDPPALNSEDMGQWRDIIDLLDESLLWDRDWDDSDDPQDSWDPARGDYFRVDSPMPSDAELGQILDELEGMLFQEE